MKVLNLILSLRTGGAERLTIEIANWVSKNTDINIYVGCLDEIGELSQYLRENITQVCFRRKPSKVDIKAVFAIKQYLYRNNIKVIHAHNVEAFLYASILKYLNPGLRVVYTQHGLPISMGMIKKYIYAYFLKKVGEVIAVSESVASCLESEYYLKKNLTIIDNGVDCNKFTIPTIELENKYSRFICVARLEKIKGIDVFIDALAKSKNREIIKVEIIGDGSERSNLERQVIDLKLENTVKFIGRNNNVISSLQEAGFFVLPSWSEGISIALLESMACGLVPIASKVGGNEKVIDEGVNGYLFNAGDIEALTKIIDYVVSNSHKNRILSLKSREKIIEKYSIERTVREYLDAYCN